ncbi:MAG: SpoVR family protein [Geminicoccaceae bacterium]
MSSWNLDDLRYWDAAIRERVQEFRLDCFPQEFEICDHHEMLGYMAYHGMPAHYPHWSYGKAYEKTKTLYDYGVSGLPYELVINSNPCLAYLMADNSLCLQVLTIAHVYGHNDFFKNNFTFTSATDAAETIGAFKARADRVRRYAEDPSIGEEAVENLLDAAHALAFCISPNAAVRSLSIDEQRERVLDARRQPEDPFASIHARPQPVDDGPTKMPPEPVADILAFLRDHHPDFSEWQRDVLDIVDAETRYFVPQIETKIMNEGWASYWHHKIMNSLDLPHELHLEFLVRHNQVVTPHPGSINPYHLGFVLWTKIEEETETDSEEMLFAVRETDRDTAFLRRFLDEKTMRELDLFAYMPKGDKLVVSEVSDEEHWRTVKDKLIRQVGAQSNPSIKITDADYDAKRELYLVHDHDGRDLELSYAEKTLSHLHGIWNRPVHLETRLNDKPTQLTYGAPGFDARLLV